MPSSDYTAAVRGGLKLKGAAATGAGIDKKKKKKKKPNTPNITAQTTSASAELSGSETAEARQLDASSSVEQHGEGPSEEASLRKLRESDVRDHDDGKTEAQRKHDERRWQRLEDRLKREGAHTHKERVEQLNKYLSKMSEHHDMPRIGPG